MKYLFPAFLASAGLLLVLPGCNRDNLTAPPCNTPNPEALTYTVNVKPILDRSCISCHSAHGSAAGDFRTYEGIKPYLVNGSVSNLVVVRQSMPPNSALSQAEIETINCWIQAGYAK